MKLFKYNFLFFIGVLFTLSSHLSFSQTGSFNYKRSLFGTPSTLSLNVQEINNATGSVTINGVDTQSPSIPFIWEWGDGTISTGFFPQVHTYSNKSKNYIVNVTATYSSGNKDSNQVLIRFIAPVINPISLPPSLAVTFPIVMPSMGSRLGPLPSQLSVFNNSFFTSIPRSTLEYLLSVCANVENDFVNNNVYQFNGNFNQVLLRDSTFAGAYSIWFSNPVAVGVGDGFLQGTIGYSSFFHEMGHNFTLNTPSTYYYGGKIDGYANAIYSESMAQIFQHSAGYEIINNYQSYGLSDDLVFDIKQSVLSSISIIRASYEQYLASGKNFASWNDPSTPVDETFNTFMTIAYKFCEHAENLGLGYKAPLKRMLNLLQGFNANWAQWYNPLNNSADADTFRATLMVTALSYAFSTDLRSEFRNLNFPVSDQTYNELYASVTSIIPPDSVRKVSPINYSVGNLQPVKLMWRQPLGAGSYRLQFGTDSIFAATLVDTTGLTDTSFIVRNLNNLTTYYWRVNAMNTGGISPWCQAWSFKTLGSPTRATLLYPLNNSTNIPLSVNFQWNQSLDQLMMAKLRRKNVKSIAKAGSSSKKKVANVSQYWFELMTDTTSNSYIRNDSTIADTTIQVTGLQNLTNYWWRVSAMNQAGWGAFTNWSKFTTLIDTPGVVVLLSPNSGSTISDTASSILFTWNGAPFASTYELQIASNKNFSPVITDSLGIIDTVFTYHPINLFSTFYWKVRGNNVAGSGPWSSTMAVSLISGINNIKNVMPVVYELYQNYPNPFNPSTVINYALPFSSNVKIEIYNILGERVRELLNAQKPPGYYSVNFNTTGLSSGIYFYMIEAKSTDGKNEYKDAKKMMLLK